MKTFFLRRPLLSFFIVAVAATVVSSWLLDPKILGVAMQAGKSLGWEGIASAVLLGILAAQWLRRGRRGDKDGSEETPH